MGQVVTATSSRNGRIPEALTPYLRSTRQWWLAIGGFLGMVGAAVALLAFRSLIGDSRWVVNVGLLVGALVGSLVSLRSYRPRHTASYVGSDALARATRRAQKTETEVLRFVDVQRLVVTIRRSLILGQRVFCLRWVCDEAVPRVRFAICGRVSRRITASGSAAITGRRRLSIDHPWHFAQSAQSSWGEYISDSSDDKASVESEVGSGVDGLQKSVGVDKEIDERIESESPSGRSQSAADCHEGDASQE